MTVNNRVPVSSHVTDPVSAGQPSPVAPSGPGVPSSQSLPTHAIRPRQPASVERPAAIPPAPIPPIYRPSDSGPLPQATLAGYELIRRLGRGGMGVVWQARNPQTRQQVALKVIHTGLDANPGEVERFLTEARAGARLQHPHIVRIFHFGSADGQPFFTMELLQGGTLRDRLRRGPLAARDAARLVRQAAQAIQYAHEQKVLHRDISPANLMLIGPAAAGQESACTIVGEMLPEGPPGAEAAPDAALEVKVCDFGLARLQDATLHQTQAGDQLGTPSYMAPEQAGGDVDRQDARTDVYGLGAVLYTCLTGRPPFHAPTAVETLLQAQRNDPAPVRALVPDVSRAGGGVPEVSGERPPQALRDGGRTGRRPGALAGQRAGARASREWPGTSGQVGEAEHPGGGAGGRDGRGAARRRHRVELFCLHRRSGGDGGPQGGAGGRRAPAPRRRQGRWPSRKPVAPGAKRRAPTARRPRPRRPWDARRTSSTGRNAPCMWASWPRPNWSFSTATAPGAWKSWTAASGTCVTWSITISGRASTPCGTFSDTRRASAAWRSVPTAAESSRKRRPDRPRVGREHGTGTFLLERPYGLRLERVLQPGRQTHPHRQSGPHRESVGRGRGQGTSLSERAHAGRAERGVSARRQTHPLRRFRRDGAGVGRRVGRGAFVPQGARRHGHQRGVQPRR